MSNMLDLPTDRARLRATSTFDAHNLADAIDAMPGRKGINRVVFVPKVWLSTSEDGHDSSLEAAPLPRPTWRSFTTYREQVPIRTGSRIACDTLPGIFPRSNDTQEFWKSYASSGTAVMQVDGSDHQVKDVAGNLESTPSRLPDAHGGIPDHKRNLYDVLRLDRHRQVSSIRRSRFGIRH